MLIAQWILLMPLLAVCSVAPGMAVVRKWPWGPGERLCAAVGTSVFLLYLGVLIIFVTGLGGWAYWLMLALCLVSAAWSWRDLVGVWRNGTARRMTLVFLAVLAYAYVCLALVRHYSGGLWSGDWWWHYQKIEVFMAGGSEDMDRVRAIIIERPPTMNLVALFFMRLVGARFETFELVFTWLNILCVLPCCLMATAFRKRARRRLWLVPAMFACLPLLLENATYTWTKLTSSYYVIFGMWLYLAAIRKRDWVRMVAAFTCLGFACIAHFVAAPYAAYILAHYLLRVWWWRPHKWRELVLSGLGGAGMILTWFGWVVWRYGVQEAVGANPTILYTRNYSAATNAMRVARNIVYTVIPHPLRMSASDVWQPDWMGTVRDYTFLIYQSNLLFGMGSVAGVVALYLLHERLKSRRPAGRAVYWVMAAAVVGGIGLAYVPVTRDVLFVLFPTHLLLGLALVGLALLAGALYRAVRGWGEGVPEEVWFWRGFVVTVPFVAVAGHDYLNYYGLGHIFFHSLSLLAITLVAVCVWDCARWVRWAVAGGMALDFVLGIWLQFHLEHRVFRLTETGAIDTGGLSKQTGINWYEKVKFGYTFVGDHLAGMGPVLEGVLVLAAAAAVWAVARGPGGRRNLDRGGWGGTISG